MVLKKEGTERASGIGDREQAELVSRRIAQRGGEGGGWVEERPTQA